MRKDGLMAFWSILFLAEMWTFISEKEVLEHYSFLWSWMLFLYHYKIVWQSLQVLIAAMRR